MKFYMYPLLILLFLTQCSTKKDEDLQAFINQLTTNTWYLPDPLDPNSPSSTPLDFNSDGSFTYNFTDIEGVTTLLVHKIETIGHATFAYYTFDYTLNGEVLKLYMGVGIGLNYPSQKPVVYQSDFKKTNTKPSVSATTEDKKTWYTETYKESNIITHKGPTLAIQ